MRGQGANGPRAGAHAQQRAQCRMRSQVLASGLHEGMASRRRVNGSAKSFGEHSRHREAHWDHEDFVGGLGEQFAIFSVGTEAKPQDLKARMPMQMEVGDGDSEEDREEEQGETASSAPAPLSGLEEHFLSRDPKRLPLPSLVAIVMSRVRILTHIGGRRRRRLH